MKIKIHDNLSVNRVFAIAKYKKHPKGNGFIRGTELGRYHAVYQGGKEFDLHFDIYGQNGHWAPYMPYTCGKEKAKILGICKSLGGVESKRKEYKPKETMQVGEVVLIHQIKSKENKRIKEEKRKLNKQERKRERLKILHDSTLTGQALKDALALVS